MTEYRMGKPRTVTDKPLKRNEPLELSGKLKLVETLEEKRQLVSTSMGELFYAFGEKRRAWRPWLNYEENFARLFIGEPK
jgi:hypothetical protein